MIEYLDLEDLPGITRRAVGGDIKVGDYGSLASALARPHFRCSARMPVPIYTSGPRRTIALSGTPPRADGREQTACVDGMSNVLSVNGQWISAPEDDRIEFCRLGGHGRAGPSLGEVAEQLRAWSYQEGGAARPSATANLRLATRMLSTVSMAWRARRWWSPTHMRGSRPIIDLLPRPIPSLAK